MYHPKTKLGACALAGRPARTHGSGARSGCPGVIFGDPASAHRPPGRPGRTDEQMTNQN